MKLRLIAPAFALPSLALSLAAAPSALAHDRSSGPVIAPRNTMLSLSAQGQSFSAPDLTVFTAGVTGSGKTAAAALAANSAKMNEVFAALKRAGIAEKDIQTSNLSLNPVYADMSGQRDVDPLEQRVPLIIGYQVYNMVTVKQRRLDRYGNVIDALVAAGANQVNGPNFQMNDPDAAADEARADAIRKAMNRAQLYAKASGLSVIRVLTITEGGGYAPKPPIMYARAAMAEVAAAPPVAAGEVQSGASVTVTFELGE
ncbi:MAG: DUF541 domain-containing protein [Alphaproteobacteria bacterium]|nr:DUF541 domain-containing protein [Alphaproteobacteria bacterium]